MTPSQMRAKIVTQRTSWIRQMVAAIRALPLNDWGDESDSHAATVAEYAMYLERGEAQALTISA